MARIKNNVFFKPIWNELDSMLDARLYVGDSAKIVEDYCSRVQTVLAPYKEYIESSGVAELHV